jgi:N-dimethylarginine dimethylaminohydrolase
MMKGASSPSAASGKDANTMKTRIFIGSEFGALREVIVGEANGRNPSLEAAWLREALKVLPEAERQVAIANAGKNWSECVVDPQTGTTEYDLIKAENDAFVKILESLGVKVLRPALFGERDVERRYGREALANGYSQDFPRDNLIIIGSNVVEANLRTPLRRVDIEGFRSLLMERCMAPEVRWAAMPHVPLLGEVADDAPLLEGGDIIVLGKTVLVGNSENKSVGSSEAGYRWLKNYLGDGYDVIRVPLRENVLHLDCTLSVPRNGLAILCPEAFTEGIPDVLKDWDLIPVGMERLPYLVVNGLPVNENTYIMGYNNHDSNAQIRVALEQRGITVYPIFFGAHNAQGGSLRCATQALLRDA